VSFERNTPLVYLISDGRMTDENHSSMAPVFLDLVFAASNARITLIQIREKRLSARNLYELTKAVVTTAANSRTRVLVNNRVDIAMAAGADGVHLSSQSVPANVVRRHVPTGFLIGASTHSTEEITEAKQASADFMVFGPVFDTPGKGRPTGLEQLRSACAIDPDLPVLALGGIDQTNYRGVIDAGAAGFAAIRFLNDAENLVRVSRELGL
jgi:thiamine-phosphate pyrophosphorylase